MKKIVIITLFPEMFAGILSESILKRAIEKQQVEVDFVNLRDFGIGPRKTVDDTPYGGGAGMVLRVDVLSRAIQHAISNFQFPISKQRSNSGLEKSKLNQNSKFKTRNYKIILLTPQGHKLNQSKLKEMAEYEGDYVLICGHYEGYDERIRGLADEQISVGDFVLTGGEIPAMLLVDGISRLLPGVLGNETSYEDESHATEGRIEYPHYTRPEVWEGQSVPEVLKSGNHGEIAKWREEQSRRKSK